MSFRDLLFEQLKKRVGDDHVAVAIIHELSKDAMMQQIREERERNGNGFSNARNGVGSITGDQPSMDRQISYLKAINVKIPKGLTKQWASDQIDEAQANTAWKIP